jgi:hypothetical protein
MLGHIAKVGSTVQWVRSQRHARYSIVTSGVGEAPERAWALQASPRDRDLCATNSRIRSYCGMRNVPRKLEHQDVVACGGTPNVTSPCAMEWYWMQAKFNGAAVALCNHQERDVDGDGRGVVEGDISSIGTTAQDMVHN